MGDFCVATVEKGAGWRKSRKDLPTNLATLLASVSVRGNQGEMSKDLNPTLLRSRSDNITDVIYRSNARKQRAPSVTQASSVSLPAWPSEEFASAGPSGSQWNPWSTGLNPRVSPEVIQEQDQAGLEPTDLRTSKSRQEEEEEGELCSGSS